MKKRVLILSILSLLLTAGLSASAFSATTQDVTSSFSQTMRDNGAWMAYYALIDIEQETYPLGTGLEFASKVKSGGVWDYKLTLGVNTPYVYGGYNVTGEDLGNIHYGYVGRASGFSKTLLLSAAGAVQIYSGTAHINWYASYFDDPNDQQWIDHGIRRFDNGTLPTSFITSTSEVQIDTSLIHTLTEEQKKEIREIAIARSNEIKEEQKSQ